MPVIRTEKTHGYTVITNHPLRDKALSLRAKGLLCLMLSLPENWNYSAAGLAAICKEGRRAVMTTLQELEEAGYLIRRKKRGEDGQMTGAEYWVYERPQSAGRPMDGRPAERGAQLKKEERRKEEENKEKIIFGVTGKEGEKLALARERVKENIGYDYLSPAVKIRRTVDELVELMVEFLCTEEETVRIGGERYPAGFVRERILAVDDAHITYILERMKRTAPDIRDIRAYLRAALFNAPTTIDHYYEAELRRDLRGC